MTPRHLVVVRELVSNSLLFVSPQRQMLAGDLGDLERFGLLGPGLRAIARVNAFLATIAQRNNQQTIFVRQQAFQFPAHLFHIAHRQPTPKNRILQSVSIAIELFIHLPSALRFHYVVRENVPVFRLHLSQPPARKQAAFVHPVFFQQSDF